MIGQMIAPHVLIASFLLSPAANIPNVINIMANAPVLLDMAEMIV